MNLSKDHPQLAECHFAVNDTVRIRWGQRRGHIGRIVQRQLARVYRVRFPDGEELFYAEEGLDPWILGWPGPAAPLHIPPSTS
jgi:hypothetical protein